MCRCRWQKSAEGAAGTRAGLRSVVSRRSESYCRYHVAANYAAQKALGIHRGLSRSLRCCSFSEKKLACASANGLQAHRPHASACYHFFSGVCAVLVPRKSTATLRLCVRLCPAGINALATVCCRYQLFSGVCAVVSVQIW